MTSQTSRSVACPSRGRLRGAGLLAGLAVVVLGAASPAAGQFCAPTRAGVFLSVDGTIGPPVPAPTCLGAFYCKKPELTSPTVSVEFVPDPVDPTRQGGYLVRAVFPFVAEGNNQNDGTSGTTTDFRVKFHVFDESAPPGPDCFPGINGCNPIGTCGIPGASVPYDQGEVIVEIAARCDDFGTGPGQISGLSVSALRCATPAGTCNTRTDSAPITLPDLQALGLYCPPKPNCCNARCRDCRAGANVGGGAGGYCPLDHSTGRGARLAWSAGGPGTEAAPGGAAWRQALGRGWSHDYAERIVEAPDDTHVWLINKTGNFHEFWSPVGGVYQGSAPADEYRTLSRTAGGWDLRHLDGTVDSFGADGRWQGSADPAGNATIPAYDAGGVLLSVSFPDGRGETFSYHPDGKLATITEVGVDAVPQRTWSYGWSGDDLARVDRPDGTAEEYFYGDGRFPGYLTRIDELGTDASRRVKKAWEYDAAGNVVKTWRGDTVAGPNGDAPGAAPVDLWALEFDDPTQPAATLVTDPLGAVATYQVEREPQSGKTRVTSISGDCPTCGLGPNTQFFYDDPVNPMLPTRIVDGRGNTTVMSYDGNGQPLSRTEALGTAEERTMTWTYGDPAFPGLATEIEEPSTSDGAVRRTEIDLDAAGRPEQRTTSGVEAGSAFSFTTTTTYNGSGRPETVDPPGYGTADVTSFTYDPGRGSLVVLTQTDPLIGTTSYAYDALNRQTLTTDPNGVVTELAYDAMDRVTQIVERGATPGGDLVTVSDYNAFGQLERTTLPEGNVVEYEYDEVGRLLSVARGPAAGDMLERTRFELDQAGNRTNEQHQRWTGAGWETTAETEYVFDSRCRMSRIIRAPGTVEEATTEYAYDCNGNLESAWDANHSSDADPPSRTYTHDALDRVTKVTEPWAGAGGGTASTVYGYDVQDHLISIADPEGNTTRFVYSDRGLMTEQSSPVSGVRTFSYNEHGQLVTEVDGRGVTTSRAVDALDRLLFVDSTENALDTTLIWDDPAVPFSKGRLTAIVRSGSSVSYAYDRFGRTIQDGDLAYAYDRNGNRAAITYPGGVTATYEHDFADRPRSLTIADGASTTPAVTDAAYLPSGPLTALTLGNGTSEARGFDLRYFPKAITVPGLIDWDLTTDSVGNVTQIADALNPAESRGYGYQDTQYFLTQGDGPWGTLAWTYDKTGNRLSETRDGATSVYSYVPSATGGHAPKLSQVTEASGETTRYFHDAAGNQTYRSLDAAKHRFTYDARGRLSQIGSDAPDDVATRSSLSYDGRGYLSGASLSPFPGRPPTVTTKPTYSSTGTLMHRRTEQVLEADDPRSAVALDSNGYVFYFSGRPVGILEKTVETAVDGTTSEATSLRYLTTDHLGTPILATDGSASLLWRGGFEPFGRDFAGAAGAGVFLRLPGQWDDPAWSTQTADAGVTYNLHRWYQPATGTYTRSDLLITSMVMSARYRYAASNPLRYVDRSGLQAQPVPDTPPPAPAPRPAPNIRPVPPPACRPAPLGILGRLGGALTVILNELFNPTPLGGPGISDFADPNCDPKCGDCDPHEHGFLQYLVNKACKSGPRRCSGGMSAEQLSTNFQKNIECYYARREINDRCFRGGDDGHQKAATAAANAAIRCLDMLTAPGG